MSCIVLDIEVADQNDIEELGVFNDGKVQGYSFRPPKKYIPTKKAFWGTRDLNANVWSGGRSDYNEPANVLSRAVKAEFFAKITAKCKILVEFLDKESEKMDDLGCPKVRNLVHEEMWLSSNYPFRHKTTLHCADKKIRKLDNAALVILKFYCEMYCHYLRI